MYVCMAFHNQKLSNFVVPHLRKHKLKSVFIYLTGRDVLYSDKITLRFFTCLQINRSQFIATTVSESKYLFCLQVDQCPSVSVYRRGNSLTEI